MAPRARGNHLKRKNYSIETKLDIIRTYAKGVKGCGIAALSKKHGVESSTLRGWIDKKPELEAALTDLRRTSRTQRRLSGGGRKPMYENLENELEAWIAEKNAKGLHVRDQYIQAKAMLIHKQQMQIETEQADEVVHKIFSASTGWLARFKNRKNIVLRRHATNRTLAEGMDDTCRSFIENCHSVIDTFQISSNNIFNMDQVPGYFEIEPSFMHAKQGNGEVPRSKKEVPRKRFVVTFTISLSGEILKPHILFSYAEKESDIDPGVLVDDNHTGIWTEETLVKYINSTIASRHETAEEQQHVLFIVSSRSPHTKLLDNVHLKAMNIHLVIVPQHLTSILQPLNVAINREFRQHYTQVYNAYIAKAMDDVSMQTPAGKPKCPSYQIVTNWVGEWVKTKVPDEIKNAFCACGLVAKTDFDPGLLHPPLKAFFDPEFKLADWNNLYARDYVDAPEPLNLDILVDPAYFVPEKGGTGTPSSLWRCLHRAKYGESSDILCSTYRTEVVSGMKGIPELADITDEEFYSNIENGAMPDYRVVAFAVMTLDRCTIRIQDAADLSFKVYEHAEPTKTIDLVRIDDFFVLKL